MIRKWFLKQLSAMIQPAFSWRNVYLPRTKFDYQAEVGTGLGSSVIMAPVMWIARTFLEAPFTISRIKMDGTSEIIADHPLSSLIARPNDFYSGLSLWKATMISWLLDGNAYWIKVRSQRNRSVRQLWYVPHWQITPRWPADDKTVFLSHYEYSPGGTIPIKILPEDIVHFRDGIDPRNTRKGLSPLHSVLREIFTDDEASNMTASLMRNMGVAGVVISPKSAIASPDDAQATKEYFTQQFTGDFRGEPLVMRAPTEVSQFGFEPRRMELSNIRDVSEERVCAALGIEPAVVGFGAGLQQTKVGATMREMIALAWKACIVPNQIMIADAIDSHLLPDFEPEPQRFRMSFDTSSVEAMQESANERTERWNSMVAGGWAEVAEARAANGLPVDDSHRIFLRPISLAEIPASAKMRRLVRKDAVVDRLIEDPPPRRRVQAFQRELIRRLDAERDELEAPFRGDLDRTFAELGREAERAARSVLKQHAESSIKESIEDEVDEIIRKMPLKRIQREFQEKGGVQFLEVAVRTFGTVGIIMSLEIGMRDEVAEEIIALGGRRLGLIDLTRQTRDRLFRVLTEARERGAGIPEQVREIREFIPAGPWADARTRAKVIAREETKFAQRTSVLRAYGESGVVTRVIVLDDRIGFGDEECVFWNGREIDLSDADSVSEDEHPNGTRDFVPVIA